MRMTSDNLGIAGLQDEKSSVAIAGVSALFFFFGGKESRRDSF